MSDSAITIYIWAAHERALARRRYRTVRAACGLGPRSADRWPTTRPDRHREGVVEMRIAVTAEERAAMPREGRPCHALRARMLAACGIDPLDVPGGERDLRRVQFSVRFTHEEWERVRVSDWPTVAESIGLWNRAGVWPVPSTSNGRSVQVKIRAVVGAAASAAALRALILAACGEAEPAQVHASPVVAPVRSAPRGGRAAPRCAPFGGYWPSGRSVADLVPGRLTGRLHLPEVAHV